mmetsp:Transcript_78978/g.203443  ORF Transcript_78978/g.203443 Transcript_78978/m.203443 type:complete len:92 (+) Transcript_78978:220-495(+)
MEVHRELQHSALMKHDDQTALQNESLGILGFEQRVPGGQTQLHLVQSLRVCQLPGQWNPAHLSGHQPVSFRRRLGAVTLAWPTVPFTLGTG